MDINLEFEIIRLSSIINLRDKEIELLQNKLAALKTDYAKVEWCVTDMLERNNKYRDRIKLEQDLADGLAETLGVFIAQYGGKNAKQQLKDYVEHCKYRRNK